MKLVTLLAADFVVLCGAFTVLDRAPHVVARFCGVLSSSSYAIAATF
jgi:hypothetical protein